MISKKRGINSSPKKAVSWLFPAWFPALKEYKLKEKTKIKLQKFGSHSLAPEITEDLRNKKVTEKGDYSNAKGFTLVVSCAKKICSNLRYIDNRSPSRCILLKN